LELLEQVLPEVLHKAQPERAQVQQEPPELLVVLVLVQVLVLQVSQVLLELLVVLALPESQVQQE
jgi:hypothetical protein